MGIGIYKKWDIVEDTACDNDFKYLLVSSSNNKKIYGFPIVLRHQKLHAVRISIPNTEHVIKIGELDMSKLAIETLEKIKR